ncbi:CBS domain-containing protein [Frankia gtarii]|uniref:CBS domain-containing protein n=1 Tax=Frankia gtarii TaxID=2950102 RepID=UPI0027E05C9F|nr:CBS domain-containing protein [Frankia gtarii]
MAGIHGCVPRRLLDVPEIRPPGRVECRNSAVRRLPVVDEDRVVGVVSLGDLAREGDNESVLGQVGSVPANR